MKISIILGTRPEIIKMSPVIRECERRGLDYFTLHTGQHYSYNLDRIFFEELGLPGSRYNLNVGSGTHGEETGRMLAGIEKVLLDEMPDVVLVQGDTNTVLAGGLAASKLHIKVGHVEAGLRSFDRTMPEEVNRVLTDHLSDYLFAPTPVARENLLHEGISDDDIYIVGNTVVDSVFQNAKIASQRSDILDRMGLERDGYILVTSHRQENVDSPKRLSQIFRALEELYLKYRLRIIYPIHPRTRKRIQEFGLTVPAGIEMIDPIGFLDFLLIEANAKAVLTDSGGVQEECCIQKVPCLTLRDNTERPETIEVGANVLCGTNTTTILNNFEVMINRSRNWANPFGDGRSAERILDILLEP